MKGRPTRIHAESAAPLQQNNLNSLCKCTCNICCYGDLPQSYTLMGFWHRISSSGIFRHLLLTAVVRLGCFLPRPDPCRGDERNESVDEELATITTIRFPRRHVRRRCVPFQVEQSVGTCSGGPSASVRLGGESSGADWSELCPSDGLLWRGDTCDGDSDLALGSSCSSSSSSSSSTSSTLLANSEQHWKCRKFFWKKRRIIYGAIKCLCILILKRV